LAKSPTNFANKSQALQGRVIATTGKDVQRKKMYIKKIASKLKPKIKVLELDPKSELRSIQSLILNRDEGFSLELLPSF